MRMIALTALLLGTACNIPPKDPFAAAEHALRHNDLLRALQAYDAVPVAHVRYPDARAGAGDVEQRMRRCHELILEALMLRAEWRDAEALDALQRARQHWPQQPSLNQWIAATEKRLQLFAERGSVAETPATEVPSSPMVEVAKIGTPQLPVATDVGDREPGSRGPEPSAAPLAVGEPSSNASESSTPLSPAETSQPVRQPVVVVPPSNPPKPLLPGPSAQAVRGESSANAPQSVASPGAIGAEGRKPSPADSMENDSHENPSVAAPQSAPSAVAPSSSAAAEDSTPTPKSESVVVVKRLPQGEDPVVLGLVAVEARLGRGELALAVRDLIELARRFPADARVNRRLVRLLHQRALVNYGQGSVVAAVTDWRRVLEIEPDNRVVRKLLQRAVAESQGNKDS